MTRPTTTTKAAAISTGSNVNADRRYLRIALLLLLAFMVTEVVVANLLGIAGPVV